MTTNQWGPYDPTVSPAPPLGDGTPGAPPIPPQSPSGAITTNIGQSESNTQTYLSGLPIDGTQQGAAALVNPPTIAGTTSVSFYNWNG